jgi:hypothetical protein
MARSIPLRNRPGSPWHDSMSPASRSTTRPAPRAGQHAGRETFAHGGDLIASSVQVDQVEGHRERGRTGVEGPAPPQHPMSDVAQGAVGAARQLADQIRQLTPPRPVGVVHADELGGGGLP